MQTTLPVSALVSLSSADKGLVQTDYITFQLKITLQLPKLLRGKAKIITKAYKAIYNLNSCSGYLPPCTKPPQNLVTGKNHSSVLIMAHSCSTCGHLRSCECWDLGQQLMLTAGQDCCRSYVQNGVCLSTGLGGFLTAWWLPSKYKPPQGSERVRTLLPFQIQPDLRRLAKSVLPHSI